jgi:phage anti-repressor protein
MSNKEKQVQKTNAELAEQLYHKLKTEHKRWLMWLKLSDKDKIIQNADLIVLYESVVDLVGNFPEFLDADDLRALLSLDNALDVIRQAWYNWDKGFYRELEDVINHLTVNLSNSSNARKPCEIIKLAA